MALLLQSAVHNECQPNQMRSKIVGRTVKSPKKHIISCRVSEGEMETLQYLTEVSGVSISDLLRQSLLHLCEQPHQESQQTA